MDVGLPREEHALVEALAGRLDDPHHRHRSSSSGVSGVLIPVRATERGPELIFTRRAQGLSSHPGQISFPGGRLDPGDAHPLAAALREAEEEVGLPAGQVMVAGHLTDYEPYRGPLICTYVGVVGREAPEPYRASPEEVAEVLRVPLSSLASPGTEKSGERDPAASGSAGGWTASTYESRVWWDEEKGDRQVHYWHMDEETTIWGITGELLFRLLDQLFDWTPPEGPRRVSGLEDFLI